MKKKFLFLMSLLAVSLFALAEMTVYVYKKDGTKVSYAAADVDSIGFANVNTITFNANGGKGSMEVLKVKVGETIMLPANTFSKVNDSFIGWNTQADGAGVAYADNASISLVSDLTLYAQWEDMSDSGTANGYEWVDLGLPSGTKWATCNVGAISPEETGDRFAWGETETKTKFNIDTYKFYNDKYTKYNSTDNKTILELSDDVANVKWGGQWCIPTDKEFKELLDECTWAWFTFNGIEGYKVTSKTTRKSIFLPKAMMSGYMSSRAQGQYWCSSLKTIGLPYWLDFESDEIRVTKGETRYYGCVIRPVLRSGFTYEAIFNSNGGEGTMPSITINHNEGFTVPANTFTRPGYEFVCWNANADGSGRNYKVGEKSSLASDIILYAQWYKKDTDTNHTWVDLGLPSGIKWATCNVGASAPEELGYYFAWGETKPKAVYNWSTYKWYDSIFETVNKYSSDVDQETALEIADDAANANWGGEWRMPTEAEVSELKNECTWTWTQQNGVEGYKVTSKTNGNSIFLPAAGYRSDRDLDNAGLTGKYWSSSLTTSNSDNACRLHFYSGYVSWGREYRYYGHPVRPVMP